MDTHYYLDTADKDGEIVNSSEIIVLDQPESCSNGRTLHTIIRNTAHDNIMCGVSTSRGKKKDGYKKGMSLLNFVIQGPVVDRKSFDALALLVYKQFLTMKKNHKVLGFTPKGTPVDGPDPSGLVSWVLIDGVERNDWI